MNLSLPVVVFLIFMTLKLCGVLAWSWWWVTVPLWGGLAAFALLFVVAATVAASARR